MTETDIIPVVINLISLLGIISLFLRYRKKKDWRKMHKHPKYVKGYSLLKALVSENDADSIFKPKEWYFSWKLWIEVLIMIVQPVPYKDRIVSFENISFPDKKSL